MNAPAPLPSLLTTSALIAQANRSNPVVDELCKRLEAGQEALRDLPMVVKEYLIVHCSDVFSMATICEVEVVLRRLLKGGL